MTTQTNTAPVRGFRCPHCGLKLHVRTTRAAARGLVVRYLACPSCKLKAITEERLSLFRRPRD